MGVIAGNPGSKQIEDLRIAHPLLHFGKKILTFFNNNIYLLKINILFQAHGG
jgi:hypothetical protein